MEEKERLSVGILRRRPHFPLKDKTGVAFDTAWEERDFERQDLGCGKGHFRKRKQQKQVQGSWKVDGVI